MFADKICLKFHKKLKFVRIYLWPNTFVFEPDAIYDC